jgi:hypothetical protein
MKMLLLILIFASCARVEPTNGVFIDRGAKVCKADTFWGTGGMKYTGDTVFGIMEVGYKADTFIISQSLNHSMK